MEEPCQNEVFEKLEIMVKKIKMVTIKLMSCATGASLLRDRSAAVLFTFLLPQTVKWQHCTLARTVPRLSEKPSVVHLSAPRTEKKYETKPTLIPGSYFLLGCFVGCWGRGMYLFLKWRNGIAMFSSILKKVSYILILKRNSAQQPGVFDGLHW